MAAALSSDVCLSHPSPALLTQRCRGWARPRLQASLGLTGRPPQCMFWHANQVT